MATEYRAPAGTGPGVPTAGKGQGTRESSRVEAFGLGPILTSSFTPRDTVYVMHPDALRRLELTVTADFGRSSGWTAWIYRYRDMADSLTYAFSGLVDGIKRATKPTRELEWRLNWYRAPESAWWEQ